MRFSIRPWLNVTAFGLALVFAPAALVAQPSTNAKQDVNPSSFAGKYEGTVKDETGEAKMVLEVVEQAGKFSGTLTAPRGTFKIIKGEVANGALVLEIEKPGGTSGTMTLRRDGNSLTATFSDAGKNQTVELRQIVADEVSGEWDAAADVQGQAFPFTLNLKVDGEKVTGTSDSQLGHSTISKGVWKDGTLTLMFDSGGSPVGLVATLDGGKLIGDFDYAGQMQGKWVAVRKK
jgi:hypothetical protein